MGVVIGALDGDLRRDLGPGANAVHVDERRRVAKVDDNGGAGRKPELPIASQASDCSLPDTYLLLGAVKAGTRTVGVAPW
jgi:hypothetical protein